MAQIIYPKIDLVKEIEKMKKLRSATILSHNYQSPEVQDLSDFVGDSLELALETEKSDNKLIIFCGVHFMAETLSILTPQKKILLPDLDAGCSLASSINVEQLQEWKKKHPNSIVISYINTSAAVKAESNICCTSTNAVKIVESIPANKEILFLPDLFLGAYVEKITGRSMHIWPGECHVHAQLTAQKINELRELQPNAEFLIHPECGCVSNTMYNLAENNISEKKTKILSTGGMIKYAKSSTAKDFIVATETGILYPLRKENPTKTFYPAQKDAVCEYMKMINLDKIYKSLNELVYEVKVPKKIAEKARKPILKMLEIV